MVSIQQDKKARRKQHAAVKLASDVHKARRVLDGFRVFGGVRGWVGFRLLGFRVLAFSRCRGTGSGGFSVEGFSEV